MPTCENFFNVVKSLGHHEGLGRLIRDWATGSEKNMPHHIDDLIKLLIDRSPEVHASHQIPTNVSTSPSLKELRTVRYVKAKEGELIVVIPTKEMLDFGESHIDSQKSYSLPEEYNVAFDGAPKAKIKRKERKALFYARIGDYSVNSCM